MSPTIKEQFELSASLVKELKQKPSDDELLKLYGLYKQGITGDCNTDQPSLFSVKERAKWNAWNGNKGMKKEKAMDAYTTFVLKLGDAYGIK